MAFLPLLEGGIALAEMAMGAAEAAELAEAAVAMEEGLPLLATGARATTVSEMLVGAGRAAATRGRLAARAAGRLAPEGYARLTAKGVLQATAVGAAVGAAQKGLEAFGYKSKKRRREPDNSLSPAQRRKPSPPERPGMPPKKPGKRPGRASKKASKKTTKVRMKTKAKSSKKTAKKDKKIKKKSAVKKNVSVKYETHGLIQRDDVSYFGFQSTGGLDELFEISCESVLRALLRRFKIQIRSPDENLNVGASVPTVDRFRIYSRRRDYSDGTDDGEVYDDLIMSGTAYKTVVANFASAMRTRAESGYFPYYMIAYNSNGTASGANEVMRDTKFGQAKVTLGVSMKVKLRNITPNDGDGTDRFALDTNPLQGRLYKFAGDVPRVREAVYETDPASFDAFHDRQCTSGIVFGPQRNASGDHTGAPDAAANIMGAGKIMSSPPANGKIIWSNCVSTSAVEFGAGAKKTHMLKFTFNGTFVKFLQKYYTNQFTLPNIGTCHLLGLEQVYKQKKKAASGQHTSDGHDHVVIEYDVDAKLSGGCAFAAAERAPNEVVTVAAHNSAPVT